MNDIVAGAGAAFLGCTAVLSLFVAFRLIVRAFRRAARIYRPPVPGQPHPPGGAVGRTAPRIPVARAAPAPGWAKVPAGGIYGRLVMASYFYDTGITVTDDLVRYRRMVDVPPPEDDDIAEFLGGEVPGDGV